MIKFKNSLSKNNPFNPYKNKVRIEKFIYYIQLEGETFKSIKELDDKFLISNYGRVVKKAYKSSNNRINHKLIKIYNDRNNNYYFYDKIDDNHKNKIFINKYLNDYFNKDIDDLIINNCNKGLKTINANERCYNFGKERKIVVTKNNKIISVLNITKTSKLYNISDTTIRKIINKNIPYNGYIFKDYINNDISDKNIKLKFTKTI